MNEKLTEILLERIEEELAVCARDIKKADLYLGTPWYGTNIGFYEIKADFNNVRETFDFLFKKCPYFYAEDSDKKRNELIIRYKSLRKRALFHLHKLGDKSN